MNIRHKHLTLDEARAGVILSAAVVDVHGNVLLPAESVLTDTMLRALARRGVESLQVVDDALSQAQMEAERVRHRGRLAVLFRRYPAVGEQAIADQLEHGVPAGADLLLRSMARFRLGSGA